MGLHKNRFEPIVCSSVGWIRTPARGREIHLQSLGARETGSFTVLEYFDQAPKPIQNVEEENLSVRQMLISTQSALPLCEHPCKIPSKTKR